MLTPVGQTVDDNGEITDDYVMDDSALAIKTEEGLVVVTGCSHAGIANIIEYAKQVTGENHIVSVIGGFHLQMPMKIASRRQGIILKHYPQIPFIHAIVPILRLRLAWRVLSKSTRSALG